MKHTVSLLSLLVLMLFAIPIVGLILAHNQGFFKKLSVPEMINEVIPATDAAAIDTTDIF